MKGCEGERKEREGEREGKDMEFSRFAVFEICIKTTML